MNYIGHKCKYCDNEFSDGDDIVVCPDCGTPYHRNCYKEAGNKCINAELHESGIGWASTVEEKQTDEKTGYVLCENCMAKNPENTATCVNCGKQIKNENSEDNAEIKDIFSQFDSSQKYFGLNPDEDFEGTRLEEVAEFVNTNTIYYLPLFKRMKEFGGKISLNFVCFFFSPLYFANRKMWPMAIFALIFSMLLDIPNILISFIEGFESASAEGFFSSPFLIEMDVEAVYQRIIDFLEPYRYILQDAEQICGVLSLFFNIIMCLFGNWIYYRFTIKSIKKIKSRTNGNVPMKTILNSAGGTSIANVIITVVIYVAIYFAFSSLLIMLFS